LGRTFRPGGGRKDGEGSFTHGLIKKTPLKKKTEFYSKFRRARIAGHHHVFGQKKYLGEENDYDAGKKPVRPNGGSIQKRNFRKTPVPPLSAGTGEGAIAEKREEAKRHGGATATAKGLTGEQGKELKTSRRAVKMETSSNTEESRKERKGPGEAD